MTAYWIVYCKTIDTIYTTVLPFITVKSVLTRAFQYNIIDSVYILFKNCLEIKLIHSVVVKRQRLTQKK